MHKVDLDRLPVHLTHLLDPNLVGVMIVFINKGPQKVAKLPSDELNDFRLVNPCGQVLLLVGVVINTTKVLLFILRQVKTDSVLGP